MASMNRCFLTAGCQLVSKTATTTEHLTGTRLRRGPTTPFPKDSRHSVDAVLELDSRKTEIARRLGQNTTTRPSPIARMPARHHCSATECVVVLTLGPTTPAVRSRDASDIPEIRLSYDPKNLASHASTKLVC